MGQLACCYVVVALKYTVTQFLTFLFIDLECARLSALMALDNIDNCIGMKLDRLHVPDHKQRNTRNGYGKEL
jgi:hypothetical protein